MLDLEPRRPRAWQHLHRRAAAPARAPPARAARSRRRRRSSGRTRAASPAARGARRRRPARRTAASARSRSTTSAWAANSCWRRSPSRSISRWTYRSGRRGVDRRHAGAVELEEHADALARLGRHLRRLDRRRQRRDHVELAPAGDLGAAGDVDRAQLDRRPRQRAHDRAGVGGIGEQPQPGQHVADLGPLEERRLADQPVRHRPLLERHARPPGPRA